MRFDLTVLGSNGALPGPRRYPSGHFLRTEAQDVLIDCGEGTQMRLQQAGLGIGRVARILITHLHGDHYFGLPGLLTSLALQGRQSPLTIVSPPGLRARIAPLLELDRYGLPFPLRFAEYATTEWTCIHADAQLEIFAFPLRHRIATNGYLIREAAREPNLRKAALRRYGIPWQVMDEIKAGAGYVTPEGVHIPHEKLVTPAAPPRSYAYCSDTVAFPQLSDYVRGVDLLYHEATFLSDMQGEAAERGHSTAAQAARIARDAGAGRLLLGHFSARYATVVDHEREARRIFPRSYAVRDLQRYAVPYRGRGEAGEEE